MEIGITQPNAEFVKLKTEFELIDQDYEKLSIVAREANVAVSLMDYNGNFKWINAGYTALYGFTFEQLLQEKGKSIFGRYTDPSIKVAFGKCIMYKKTQQYEYYNTRRDGSKIWLQSILTPIFDPATGKVVQLITIDADISEVKRAQEEIQQQKEELQSQAECLAESNAELEKLSIVAAKTGNVVLITDSCGVIEWGNDAFTQVFGYSLDGCEDHLGLTLQDVSLNPEIESIIGKCIKEKRSVGYESHHEALGGEVIWLQTTLTPIFDDHNEISKLIAVGSDISKIKEAEMKIQMQAEELQAANEKLEETQEELIMQSEGLKEMNNLLEEQKRQLEYQNLAIKSSITYALTIQTAILPPKELISKDYDCFILYKPKDIVSGDFYWYANVENEDGNYRFIAVIDCTGHGVPGAFMSVIGSRLLNEIVVEKGILDPVYILDFLNMGVKMALRQSVSSNEDGMDVCLCRIENVSETERKIVFSGAKLPLFYYLTEHKELNQLKGSRKAVGGNYYDHLSFIGEELMLHKGDYLYLSSDGYMDQNNEKRKRLGTKLFLEILEGSASGKPMHEQELILRNELAIFQQKESQRDDITVLGLKL